MIKAIIAHALDGAIGKDGKLLWHLPRDLEYFKEQTLEGVVVMGHNTFKSLPFQEGLPDRDNWVVTRDCNLKDTRIQHKNPFYDTYFDDLEANIEDLQKGLAYPVPWVIGGKSIYEQMEHLIDEWHISEVQSKFPDADTFYQPDLTDFEKVGDEIDVSSDELEAFVQVWRRKK